MKYYIYVSESKINMLFSQIGQSAIEQQNASLSIDLKILKSEYKKTIGVPSNQFTKLNSVIKQLEKKKLLGSIEEQTPYIRGTLRMVWVTYGFDIHDSRIVQRYMGSGIQLYYDRPLQITFWGYDSPKLVLGLAGSKYHLLGEERKGYTHSGSDTGTIINWLLKQLDFSKGDIKRMNWEIFNDRLLTQGDIAKAIRFAIKIMEGPESKFEFIAKVLNRYNWDLGSSEPVTNIILATPLYVALEE